MTAAQRQKKIVAYLIKNKTAKPKNLLEYVAVTSKKPITRMTISRDLQELLKQGKIEQQGSGRGSYYSLVKLFFLQQKINVEKYFSIPQDNRKILTSFNFEIFSALKQGSVFSNKEISGLQKFHEKYCENRKNLQNNAVVKKELERIIIEFSWKSSQIEGNTYSLLDTEVLLKENKLAKGKTAEETQMIINHKKAFTYIYNYAKEFTKLTKTNLGQVHNLLVEKLNIEQGFRSKPVGIIGSNYQPLDNIHQVIDGIEKMIILVNSKKLFFEKAFIALLLLSYLQAFADGNKRTARLVSNAILLAYGSIPMSYRAVDEVEYKKATLLFYEQNSLAYFKQIFMEQFEFAVTNYFQT